MANVPGALVGLVGGQVAGRVLGGVLASGAGERFLLQLDRRPLTPLEHRVLAQKWSGHIGKAVSGAAAALFLAQRSRPDRGVMGAAQRSLMGGPTVRTVDWVQVTHRVAEMLLAIGAICKVVGEYLEDRKRVGEESERAAAKRLV